MKRLTFLFILEVLLFLLLLPLSFSIFTTFSFYIFFAWNEKTNKTIGNVKLFRIIDLFHLLALGVLLPFSIFYFFSFTSFSHYYVYVLNWFIYIVFLNTFMVIDFVKKKRPRKRKIETLVFLLIMNITCSYFFYKHNSLIRYNGERDNQGKMSGHGIWTYTDGTKYSGGWFNHKRHGKGVVIYNDGKECKGLWENDILVKKLGCTGDSESSNSSSSEQKP